MSPEVVKRGPWRRVGKYIGRDVWLADGRRTTELQHRVIAAEKVGRALRSDEHAHHDNEVKTDNRPENLEVLSKAEHTRRHFATGQRTVDLVCAWCRTSFTVNFKRRGRAKFCSRRCSSHAAGEASARARSGNGGADV